RHERRAARPGRALRRHARAAARAAARGARRHRDRALLRARDVGDGGRAVELRAQRRSQHLGSRRGNPLNRAADIVVAGTTLAGASPLYALAALAVKLEDRGPVVYRQSRVGKDGVDFELLKLRTMVVGAETMGAGLSVNQGDERITRTGRLL